jgi:hypothetical protein
VSQAEDCPFELLDSKLQSKLDFSEAYTCQIKTHQLRTLHDISFSNINNQMLELDDSVSKANIDFSKIKQKDEEFIKMKILEKEKISKTQNEKKRALKDIIDIFLVQRKEYLDQLKTQEQTMNRIAINDNIKKSLLKQKADELLQSKIIDNFHADMAILDRKQSLLKWKIDRLTFSFKRKLVIKSQWGQCENDLNSSYDERFPDNNGFREGENNPNISPNHDENFENAPANFQLSSEFDLGESEDNIFSSVGLFEDMTFSAPIYDELVILDEKTNIVTDDQAQLQVAKDNPSVEALANVKALTMPLNDTHVINTELYESNINSTVIERSPAIVDDLISHGSFVINAENNQGAKSQTQTTDFDIRWLLDQENSLPEIYLPTGLISFNSTMIQTIPNDIPLQKLFDKTVLKLWTFQIKILQKMIISNIFPCNEILNKEDIRYHFRLLNMYFLFGSPRIILQALENNIQFETDHGDFLSLQNDNMMIYTPPTKFLFVITLMDVYYTVFKQLLNLLRIQEKVNTLIRIPINIIKSTLINGLVHYCFNAISVHYTEFTSKLQNYRDLLIVDVIAFHKSYINKIEERVCKTYILKDFIFGSDQYFLYEYVNFVRENKEDDALLDYIDASGFILSKIGL